MQHQVTLLYNLGCYAYPVPGYVLFFYVPFPDCHDVYANHGGKKYPGFSYIMPHILFYILPYISLYIVLHITLYIPLYFSDCQDVYQNHGGKKYPGFSYIMIQPYTSRESFEVCCKMTNESGKKCLC